RLRQGGHEHERTGRRRAGGDVRLPREARADLAGALGTALGTGDRSRQVPHPASHPHDQHPQGHEHAKHGDERPVQGDPYPFIYSKDPWDRRRFGPPGAAAPSSGRRLPNAAVWFSWVIIVLVLGGGLLSVVLRA